MAKNFSKSKLDIPTGNEDNTNKPFKASKKIYITGSRPDLKVPMREIEQTSTMTEVGEEKNPRSKRIC